MNVRGEGRKGWQDMAELDAPGSSCQGFCDFPETCII